MRPILYYLKDYYSHVPLRLFVAVITMTGCLVYLNYTFGIERRIVSIDDRLVRFAAFFCLFTFVFGASYLLTFLFKKEKKSISVQVLLLVLVSAAIFAMKMSLRAIPDELETILSKPSFTYWRLILQWPVKAVLVCSIIWLIWLVKKFERPVAGLTIPVQGLRPYYILLCAAIPLLVLASTSPSFQSMYPRSAAIFKMDNVTDHPWLYTIFYEIAYGVDFFTIEFFFRGFLILAFSRFVGKDAILPMAAFYCAIHFGKPLAECISSFFGGLMLGAIVYNTRSIWGGFVIHLGIAWGMEVFGWILYAKVD